MPIVLTTSLRSYFCLFSQPWVFNLPVRASKELYITAHLWSPLRALHIHTSVHTNTKGNEKKKGEEACPNSRAKASSLVLCYTAKLTLGMFVIVLPMKLHSNPFQLPPSLTHPPFSPPSLPFQRNCSCSSEYVFHGPWWIHPVDSTKPFMHRKHSIPFQVERRWKGDGELNCRRWWLAGGEPRTASASAPNLPKKKKILVFISLK